MNPRTILTLANGRNLDLLNPTADDYRDLDWAAEHLAKENRYNGATPGKVYSVAQHLIEGVDAITAAGAQDYQVAAYFLLHDVPEAVLKDDTTPKKNAFAAIAQAKFGVLSAQIMEAFDDLTDRHDAAIHEAAGLPWPPSPEMARAVKYWDRTLLLTEWRDLMDDIPLPNAEAYVGVAPLGQRIIPLNSWRATADILCRYWRDFLPCHQRA